jgi:drug/metabolite transporter (DMT)-like permease
MRRWTMSDVSVRNALLLAMGVVAVSFSAVFIREAHAPALTIALYRNAIAAAMVLPVALVRRREELRGLKRGQVAIAVGSGALLAAHFATWIASLSYTTIAASVVLVTASPILVAAASARLFGERVGRTAFVGILVGLAGAAIVSGGDLFVLSARAFGGDLLAIAGAVAAGGYFVAGRRLRRDVSLLTYVALVYTTCALLLFPSALLAGAPLSGFPARTWGLFVLMALVPQMLGHTVFNYLLKDVSATVVAVSIMGEPVGSTLLALAFFGEVPPWTALAGGLLLLGGIYAAVTAPGRERRRLPQTVTPLE